MGDLRPARLIQVGPVTSASWIVLMHRSPFTVDWRYFAAPYRHSWYPQQATPADHDYHRYASDDGRESVVLLRAPTKSGLVSDSSHLERLDPPRVHRWLDDGFLYT